MGEIIVPRFTVHRHTMAYLEPDSWREIFDRASSESAMGRHPIMNFYRKIVPVRVATKDGLYLSVSSIRGLYSDAGHPFRRMYGEILFHTRHDRDKKVPYQCQTQLQVSTSGGIYAGEVCSVTVYVTPRTRFSEELYVPTDKTFTEYRLIGRKDVDKEVDYSYGLLRTRKMLEWNYCPPPCDGVKWEGPTGNRWLK